MRQDAMQLIAGIDQRVEVVRAIFLKRIVELKLAADELTRRCQPDRRRHSAPRHVMRIADVKVPGVAVGLALDRRVALWCDRRAARQHLDNNLGNAAGIER